MRTLQPVISHHDIARVAHDAIETYREVTGQPKRGPWEDQPQSYREGLQNAVEEVFAKGYDILDETDIESHILGAICHALAEDGGEVVGEIGSGDPHIAGEGPFGSSVSTAPSAGTERPTSSSETGDTSSSPTSDASSDSSSSSTTSDAPQPAPVAEQVSETKGPSDPNDLAPVGG